MEPLLGASVRIRNERPIRDDQPFTCSSTEVVLALAICCDFPFAAGLFENVRRDNSDYISSSPMISVLSGRKGRGDNFICEQTQDQLRLTLDYVRKSIRDLGWDSKSAQQLFYLMQVLRRDEYFFDSFLQYGVNHMFPVEAQRIFFCFQLLESAIDKEPRENWRDALARWMDVYEMILNFDEISLIVQKRHVLAHHDAGAAERKLIEIRERLKLAQNGSDDIAFLDESIPAIARSIVRGIIGKYI